MPSMPRKYLSMLGIIPIFAVAAAVISAQPLAPQRWLADGDLNLQTDGALHEFALPIPAAGRRPSRWRRTARCGLPRVLATALAGWARTAPVWSSSRPTRQRSAHHRARLRRQHVVLRTHRQPHRPHHPGRHDHRVPHPTPNSQPRAIALAPTATSGSHVCRRQDRPDHATGRDDRVPIPTPEAGRGRWPQAPMATSGSPSSTPARSPHHAAGP